MLGGSHPTNRRTRQTGQTAAKAGLALRRLYASGSRSSQALPAFPTDLKFGLSTGVNPTNAVLDQCRDIGADYVRFDYVAHDATNQARVNRVNTNGQISLLITPKRLPNGDGTTWATYWKTRLPVRMWEIMNEPDLNGYTATTYATQAKQWCDEIRAADPAAIIWLPGSFKGGDVAGKTPPDFAQAVCDAGCSFDVWSGHYFDDPPSWNSSSNGWHYADSVRTILNNNGRSGVYIASSESHPFFRNGEAAQAADVQTMLGYAAAGPTFSAQGALASVAVYRMDFFETGSFDSSLLNSNGTQRTAWTTYHDYVAAH